MLCAGHSHEALCPCVWGPMLPHPSLVPLLPPFLIWGSAQPLSHLCSSLPKAEQTLPWGSASPARAHGAAHPQLCSLIIPHVSLLAPLQSPSCSRYSQIPSLPPSQTGFCPNTPREWSEGENATRPCVLHTSPSQHLPLFWEQ